MATVCFLPECGRSSSVDLWPTTARTLTSGFRRLGRFENGVLRVNESFDLMSERPWMTLLGRRP